MAEYEKASVKISTSLAFLNSGQTAIFSTALTFMMFLAAKGVVSGLSVHLCQKLEDRVPYPRL
jgi:ATP-binding cassette subfamily B (MDR/TAP) protein 7